MPPNMKVAVIGTGAMGSGIAQALAAAGCEVRLHDQDGAQIDRSASLIEHGTWGVRALAADGTYEEDPDAILARVVPQPDLDAACDDVALVHEAVFEDLGEKLKVMREVGSRTGPDVVLASGTSGLSIRTLASQTPHPERMIGWHWCTPGAVRRLAEIIPHPRTSQRTKDFVVELARRAGKNPQIINEHPFTWGFVSSRMTVALLAEADRIVAEGVATPEQIDEIMKDCADWPLGPFEILEKASTGWDESSYARKNVDSYKIGQFMAPATFGRPLGGE